MSTKVTIVKVLICNIKKHKHVLNDKEINKTSTQLSVKQSN